MPVSSETAFARLHTILGDDVLTLVDGSVTEGLSEPYTITVRAFGQQIHYALDDLLGTRASVRFHLIETGRIFSGVITDASFLGTTRSPDQSQTLVGMYELVIRPSLYLLKTRRNCRIFQDKKIPDIIKDVMTEAGLQVTPKLSASYENVVYCTQYDESDFDFVSRLMEQEGIHYFFTHSISDGEKIVIADSNDAHTAAPLNSDLRFNSEMVDQGFTDEGEGVWSANQRASVSTKKVTLKDFSFQGTTKNMLVEKPAPSPVPDSDKGEFYDYPGKFSWDAVPSDQAGKLSNERTDGMRYATIRLQSVRAERLRTFFEGRASDLAPGMKFNLIAHADSLMQIEYLVIATTYRFTMAGHSSGGASGALSTLITAIPSSTPYRPPIKTPRAMVFGPQTAMVVGKTKKTDEIFTDKFGRVKVRFHWDKGPAPDEKASCWVRVSQLWAGSTWGGMALPRVGQEVIVEFLDGDPDRPIITGRVYNATMMPPYTLPDNNRKFTIKSASKNGSGFNELRFDDTDDAEELYMHAEKDMKTEVLNNQVLEVKMDRTVTVKEGNEKYTVSKGNQDIEVSMGNQKTKIGQGNRDVEVSQGNQALKVSMGNQSTEVSMGNQTTKTPVGSIKMEAGMEIELKVAGNSIKIDNTGVTINGIMISISGQATAELKSPMTTVKGDGMLIAKGGMVMIN